MKKITTILSLVAIVASVLFVSCAQKKEPDLVLAFPAKKVASYSYTEGKYQWSFDDIYKYTAAKGGGFKLNEVNNDLLDYVISPNADWSVEVVGSATRYVEVCKAVGFSVDQYVFGDTASGVLGKNTISFRVKLVPESYEGDQECDIAMTMNGEKKIIATLTIKVKPEEGSEGGGTQASYTIEENIWSSVLSFKGDVHEVNEETKTHNYVLEFKSAEFDEAGTPLSEKLAVIEYNVLESNTEGITEGGKVLKPDTEATFAENTFVLGAIGENGELSGSYLVDEDIATGEIVKYLIVDGSLSITKDESIYNIFGNLKTEDGKVIEVNYMGTVEFKDLTADNEGAGEGEGEGSESARK